MLAEIIYANAATDVATAATAISPSRKLLSSQEETRTFARLRVPEKRRSMSRLKRSFWFGNQPILRPNLLQPFVALTCLWQIACTEDPTIWSASSKSPDGYWLAHAHTVQHTGPGANGVETIVELRRLTGLRSTTEILNFKMVEVTCTFK